ASVQKKTYAVTELQSYDRRVATGKRNRRLSPFQRSHADVFPCWRREQSRLWKSSKGSSNRVMIFEGVKRVGRGRRLLNQSRGQAPQLGVIHQQLIVIVRLHLIAQKDD